MLQVERCAMNNCNRQGHCVDKSLLTPQLLQRYERLPSNCTKHAHAQTATITEQQRLVQQFNHKEIKGNCYARTE